MKERKRDKERLSCTPRIDKFTHKWPGASVGAACTSVLPRNDTYIHLPTGDYLKGVKVRRFCATRSLTRRGKYIHFQPRFARKTATPSSRWASSCPRARRVSALRRVYACACVYIGTKKNLPVPAKKSESAREQSLGTFNFAFSWVRERTGVDVYRYICTYVCVLWFLCEDIMRGEVEEF